MKPYTVEYVNEKINEYEKKIKVNKCGKYEIKKIDGLQGIIQGYMYTENGTIDEKIIELHGPDHIWMRLTPLEIQGSYPIISRAKGKVGIVGLGLGYTVQELLKKVDVTEIVVYEISDEVISLYNKNFEKNEKVKIINVDAYEAESERFDCFFVDIYEYKLTSKVVKDYEAFNKLHNIDQYLFFGLEHFLLSCKYEEIVWVYIPEEWMEISKKMYSALSDSGKLDCYNQLDEELVSQVLSKFKDILNE